MSEQKSDPSRNKYQGLTNVDEVQLEHFKLAGNDFHELIDAAGRKTGKLNTRELEIAKMKIEEAVMWAIKGVTS